MELPPHDIETFIPPDDRYQWGASISDYGEVLYGCLEAAGARSILEIGAFQGRLTEALLDWAARNGASVVAVDPEPTAELESVHARHPELTILAETSLDAIPSAPAFDAMVIDGDHNWFTVTRELEAIAARARADGTDWPLVLLHDLGWPHARRDTYYVPERIPDEFRQSFASGVWLDPDEPGLAQSGLHFDHAAVREGGPRNGTLTAVEDFLASDQGVDLRLAIVPAFFGLGVIWSEAAGWSKQLEQLLAPYDRNPLIARLEANRIRHLVKRDVQTRLLHKLAHSGTFNFAALLSKIRNRGTPAVSVADIEAAIEMSGPARGESTGTESGAED